MKLTELTTEAIYNGIKKTAGELAIMNHQTGYYHIVIELDNELNVVDYWLAETVDGYFRAEGWYELYKIGTGSVDCNCDACSEGEDPEEWADDEAYCTDEHLEACIEQKLSELDDYFANRR